MTASGRHPQLFAQVACDLWSSESNILVINQSLEFRKEERDGGSLTTKTSPPCGVLWRPYVLAGARHRRPGFVDPQAQTSRSPEVCTTTEPIARCRLSYDFFLQRQHRSLKESSVHRHTLAWCLWPMAKPAHWLERPWPTARHQLERQIGRVLESSSSAIKPRELAATSDVTDGVSGCRRRLMPHAVLWLRAISIFVFWSFCES